MDWPAGPTERIRQTLVTTRTAIADLRPVWERMFVTLRTRARIVFDSMVNPFTGAPWAPVLPEYAKIKPKGKQNRTLDYSGRLRKSLTTGGKSGDSVFIPEAKSMTWGTSVPYAIYHQATRRVRHDGASLWRAMVGMKVPDDLKILMGFVMTHIRAMQARARGANV
jgi:phage gpG-like protein